jgi:hypothetical protein
MSHFLVALRQPVIRKTVLPHVLSSLSAPFPCGPRTADARLAAMPRRIDGVIDHGPLPVLEQVIDQWFARNQGGASR